MKIPSIRGTLLLRCGLGVGILLSFLFAATYLLVRQSLFGELDNSIKETAAILANQVELEDDSITFEWQEGIGTNSALIDDALFQFWNETNGGTTRSPGLGDRDLPRFSGLNGAPILRNIRLANGNHGRAVGLRVHPFVLPEEVAAMKERGRIIDPKSLPMVLVVARDAEPIHLALNRLRWVLGGGGLLTLGAGFVIIDRAIRSSLHPIHRLSAQIQDRAGHRLDEALDLPEGLPSELIGLANNFDLLLSRVSAVRQREKDFIRHAAHELRTPIAGLRATTDLALSKERDAAAYAAHLETCRRTAVDLGELVKRLSALVRVGQAPVAAIMESIDICEFSRECLEPFALRAVERGLVIRDEIGCEAVEVNGDRSLLRIILNNLFDNAVSYSTADSEIRVAAEKVKDVIEVSVANRTGDLPEDPERLFEPLFRAEASRHDAESHLGIGLSLSLDAARVMGASLRVDRPAPDRIVFTLALPLATT